MITAVVALVIGLITLVIGGELLVRGAVRLAEKAGVSALLIGLVILGFGTSMPELVTSVQAALAGSPDIAWGNIVGSNIANSLLILGVAAAIAPIAVGRADGYRDPIVALLATCAFAILAWGNYSHWMIGVVLIAALLLYIYYCYYQEKTGGVVADGAVTDKDGKNPAASNTQNVPHSAPMDRAAALELTDTKLHDPTGGWTKPVLLTLSGLAMLIIGGKFLVDGAIALAEYAGLSQTVIGLTVVAIGTSLPELVTSVIAAIKKQGAMAFGNVIGSNIYNILGIGGVTMMVAPQPLPVDLINRDIPLMLASAVILIGGVALFNGFGRLTGIIVTAIYLGYLTYLTIGAL